VETLTIYLLREHVTTPEQALRAGPDTAGVPLSRHELTAGRTTGVVFVAEVPDAEPPWVRMLAPVTLPAVAHHTRSGSAVLVLQAADRWFAVTFGQGRHLLARDAYVHRFGLRVALNAVDPDRVRGAQARTFSDYALQTQRQVSRLSGVEALELDVERDLVTTLAGSALDQRLGARMEGHDAVRLTGDLDVAGLNGTCERLLRESKRNRYRQAYPWIDNIREITEPRRLTQLNELAADRLGNHNFTGFDLFPAELVAEEVVQYATWPVWGGLKLAEPGTSLLSRALPVLVSAAEAESSLKRCKLIGLDAAGEEAGRWSLWECLHCELTGEGETLVLDGGRWYAVARGLVRTVERFVRGLRSSGVPWPHAERGESEGHYNERAARELGFACLDRRLIRLKGQSPIEPCDLLSPAGQFVHVKHRKGGSAPLSHLYSQAVVSCECMLEERDFRDQLRERLTGEHVALRSLISEPPVAAQLPVVLALITGGRAPGRPARELPFFSKVALRQAVRRLQGMSFSVFVDEIPTAL
jgi:uncharacterized protein (TIGR04141 family)